MHKVILIFLLTLQLLAYDFQETRYIYSIDKEIFYEGTITFVENYIEIDYKKPKEERVIYSQDDEVVQKRYFFTILKAIESADETLLSEFFYINNELKRVILLPKDLVQEYIKEVVYEKEDDKLKFLKITMQNKDWINIETSH